jgi:glycosyltransferase involved in cell wall biosynthesis
MSDISISHRQRGIPLVSFVVPSYNDARFVGECLDGLLAQTVPDFEAIVVDDGSTDDTAGVVGRYRDPRIRYLRRSVNQGLVHTLSEGLMAARGTYVARVDADDRCRPCFLEATLAVFERHPEVGLVYGDIARMDADGIVVEDPWHGIRSHEAHDGRDHLGDEFLTLIEDNIVPSTLIARREAWRSALPFPDWFAYASISDWYLNLRMARRHPIYYRARTLADYRIHGVNTHAQHVDGRAFEQTVFHVLDEMFEGDDRLREKSRMKPGVYARACFRAADRYAAQRLHREAWRCRISALRHSPNTVLDAFRARCRRVAGHRSAAQQAASL